MNDETRLFFVVDSQDTDEEIFETLEEAQDYYDELDISEEYEPYKRLFIALVRNAYRKTKENGEYEEGQKTNYNYEDFGDTFESIKTIKEVFR